MIGDIPSHWGLRWRRAFGHPYKMGTISYMGAKQQSTPLHYDDVENLVRKPQLDLSGISGGLAVRPCPCGSAAPGLRQTLRATKTSTIVLLCNMEFPL